MNVQEDASCSYILCALEVFLKYSVSLADLGHDDLTAAASNKNNSFSKLMQSEAAVNTGAAENSHHLVIIGSK